MYEEKSREELVLLEEEKYHKEQEVYREFADAKEAMNSQYRVMENAWQIRQAAKKALNDEYEFIYKTCPNHDEVWRQYDEVRDSINLEIEEQNAISAYEHQTMLTYLSYAKEAKERGDKPNAVVYEQWARVHRQKRDEANKEVRRLIEDVRKAKEEAKLLAPKPDMTLYNEKKEAYNVSVLEHKAAEDEFRRLRKICKERQDIFNKALADHNEVKMALKKNRTSGDFAW